MTETPPEARARAVRADANRSALRAILEAAAPLGTTIEGTAVEVDLPARRRRRLPNSPLPVLRLARLATEG